MVKTCSTTVILSLALAWACVTSAVHAQGPYDTDPYPRVDYELPRDGDSDNYDLWQMILNVCGSSDAWLYEFDLDGTCEYTSLLDDDAMLAGSGTGMLGDYQFYWCVKDDDEDGSTGRWHYQMDNAYAQFTEHGQTSLPTDVVRDVAIFDGSKFGFWPSFKSNGTIVGGLHCLLQPTPGATNDNTTWQYRLRHRFSVQGINPDDDTENLAHANNVSAWEDCWNAYMDMHHARVLEAIDELCGTGPTTPFAGFGVVDYEYMHMDWDFQNNICGSGCAGSSDWRTFVEGLNSQSIDWGFLNFMDGTAWEFTPQWSGPNLNWASLVNQEELFELSWNYFAHLLVMETLDACRERSTGSAKWGFYGYPRRSNGLSTTFDSAAVAVNANLSWLWDHGDADGDGVDMLCPSLYARYVTTVGGVGDGCDSGSGVDYTSTYHYYRTNIAEMEYLKSTYNSNALVLPFVWRCYGNGSPCNSEDINEFNSLQQLVLPKLFGADGVMIWDSIQRSTAGDPGSPAYKLQDLVDTGGLWRGIIEREHWD